MIGNVQQQQWNEEKTKYARNEGMKEWKSSIDLLSHGYLFKLLSCQTRQGSALQSTFNEDGYVMRRLPNMAYIVSFSTNSKRGSPKSSQSMLHQKCPKQN